MGRRFTDEDYLELHHDHMLELATLRELEIEAHRLRVKLDDARERIVQLQQLLAQCEVVVPAIRSRFDEAA
jgi:hypothetical protein